MSIQPYLLPLFRLVWRRRLVREHPYFPGKQYRSKVVRVKGWRTALLDEFGGQRVTATFMFRFFKWYF